MKAWVYAPNPIVTSGNPNLTPQDLPALARELRTVTLLDLERASAAEGRRYSLQGPRVWVIDAMPPELAPPVGNDFRFPPGHPHLAAAMAYYWIDEAFRYAEELGVSVVRPIYVDTHDTTSKSAYYSPLQHLLGFAPATRQRPAQAEDGKALLHEFAHALQWSLFPGQRRSVETKALVEGNADFFACAYFAHAGRGFNAAVVADWAQRPRGTRRLDNGVTYWQRQGHPYFDGLIWSGALWDLFTALGRRRSVMLPLLLRSWHYLTPGARFADGVAALLKADQDLYGGEYAHLIGRLCRRRGLPKP